MPVLLRPPPTTRRRIIAAGAGILGLRPGQSGPRTLAQSTDETWVESWMERLSPAEKAAQLFTVTIAGTALTSDETAWLTELKPGGVILVESNIGFAPELRALIVEVRATNPDLPPLISVDQEGGPVTRLFSDPVPGAAELALLPNDEVRELARLRGEFLADFGFTINYAPVADVAYSPDSFMAGRALGADPAAVAAKVAAIVEGTNLTPLRATAKHFPGHGRTAVDSHLALPEVDLAFAEWWETDALPFRAAVAAGVPLVMLGHLRYLAWDAAPTSLSPVVVDVLRDDLQFDGVVISDDLGMAALSAVEPFAVVDQAVAAGLDCLLYVTPPVPMTELIIYLIDQTMNGTVPIERVDGSLRRVLRLRL